MWVVICCFHIRPSWLFFWWGRAALWWMKVCVPGLFLFCFLNFNILVSVTSFLWLSFTKLCQHQSDCSFRFSLSVNLHKQKTNDYYLFPVVQDVPRPDLPLTARFFTVFMDLCWHCWHFCLLNVEKLDGSAFILPTLMDTFDILWASDCLSSTIYGVVGVFAGANPSCLWARAGYSLNKSPAQREPSLIVEAAMHGVCHTSGAVLGSVSCSRTLRHAAQLSWDLSWELGFDLPITSWPALPAEPQLSTWNCVKCYLVNVSMLAH